MKSWKKNSYENRVAEKVLQRACEKRRFGSPSSGTDKYENTYAYEFQNYLIRGVQIVKSFFATYK